MGFQLLEGVEHITGLSLFYKKLSYVAHALIIKDFISCIISQKSAILKLISSCKKKKKKEEVVTTMWINYVCTLQAVSQLFFLAILSV